VRLLTVMLLSVMLLSVMLLTVTLLSVMLLAVMLLESWDLPTAPGSSARSCQRTSAASHSARTGPSLISSETWQLRTTQ
jgi:hypothetical protein